MIVVVVFFVLSGVLMAALAAACAVMAAEERAARRLPVDLYRYQTRRRKLGPVVVTTVLFNGQVDRQTIRRATAGRRRVAP